MLIIAASAAFFAYSPAAAQDAEAAKTVPEATGTVAVDEEGGEISVTDIEIVRTAETPAEKPVEDKKPGEKKKEAEEVSIKAGASIGFYDGDKGKKEKEEAATGEVTIESNAIVSFEAGDDKNPPAGDAADKEVSETDDEQLFKNMPKQALDDVLSEVVGEKKAEKAAAEKAVGKAAGETPVAEAARPEESATGEQPVESEKAPATDTSVAGADDDTATMKESTPVEEETPGETVSKPADAVAGNEASAENEPVSDTNEPATGDDKEADVGNAPPVMPVPDDKKAGAPGTLVSEDAIMAATAVVEFATGGFNFGTGTFVIGESTDTSFMPAGPPGYSGPRTISVENEFIHIDVNTMPVDTGRFLVKTVKGDPFRDTDDNKILIYGGAVPWTSYTTIRVDGENYVFGGPTHRRAGRNALYGEVTEGPEKVDDKAITTTCEIGGLEVTQTLSIVGGPVSRLLDTVRINTVVRNTSMEPHRVGVRLVIDTLLGSNDGSPFKVGEDSITSETELEGVEIKDYWIAYDSLEDPGVVARGTLRGPGLTTPDRVIFTNWGKLADNEWEIPYDPGQTFQREGESEMDSATALYWDEATIMPDGELQYTTLYGIEYLNVAGEILSIGAVRGLGEWSTAKNQIRPYTLYGYIGNSSEIELNDVRIAMELPGGLEFAGDDSGIRRLGRLTPGSEATIGWVVQPKVAADGEKIIKIVGHAREVEDVELQTTVTLLAPPGIDTTVIAPERIARSPIDKRDYGPYGPPFPVKIRCRNKGRYHIDNLRVKLLLPDGLIFPRVHKAGQSFPRLEGDGSVEFSWKVIATGERVGTLTYRIQIESDSTETETITEKIDVDPLPITIAWTGVPETTYKGTFIPAELFVIDAMRLAQVDLSVEFDPDVLQVVRVSQGTLFVENGLPLPWKDPEIDNRRGLVSGISGRRTVSNGKGEGSLVIIHFMAKNPGSGALEAIGLKIKDFDGNNIEDFTFLPMSITVEEQ